MGRREEGERIMKIVINIITELDFNLRSMGKFKQKDAEVHFI